MYVRTSRFLSTALAFIGLFVTTANLHAQILVADWELPPPGGHVTNYNPVTNTSSQINGSINQPTGMVIGPDGFLYVSNIGANTVDRYNAATGAFVSNVISAAQFAAFSPTFQPTGIKFGPGGDLFVSRQENQPLATPGTGGVYRYNLGTQVLSPVITNITQGEGLLFAGGSLFVAELNNYTGQILRSDLVNPPTVFIPNGGAPGSTSQLAAATAMTIGPNGNMFVTDVLAMAIREYDLLGNLVNANFTSGGHLSSPADLLFNGGFLYVANIGTGGGPDGFVSRFNGGTGAWIDDVVSNLFFASAIVAVPEPSSMILLGGAAGAWYVRRRRRAA